MNGEVATSADAMKIVQVTQTGSLLDAVFDRVITPSFIPDSLTTIGAVRAGVSSGLTTVYAIVDDAEQPVGAALGEWSPRSRVQLLSYLAVLPTHRGGGHGGRLLEHALKQWRREYQPCAIVAEIEHPAAHEASEAHGHPADRVRFYRAHGARALDVPYFQPALGVTATRLYGMILILLHADPELAGPTPDTLAGEPLHEFMVEYLTGTEGGVADDGTTQALLTAMRRPDGVALVPLDADAIPVTRPASGDQGRRQG